MGAEDWASSEQEDKYQRDKEGECAWEQSVDLLQVEKHRENLLYD